MIGLGFILVESQFFVIFCLVGFIIIRFGFLVGFVLFGIVFLIFIVLIGSFLLFFVVFFPVFKFWIRFLSWHLLGRLFGISILNLSIWQFHIRLFFIKWFVGIFLFLFLGVLSFKFCFWVLRFGYFFIVIFRRIAVIVLKFISFGRWVVGFYFGRLGIFLRALGWRFLFGFCVLKFHFLNLGWWIRRNRFVFGGLCFGFLRILLWRLVVLLIDRVIFFEVLGFCGGFLWLVVGLVYFIGVFVVRGLIVFGGFGCGGLRREPCDGQLKRY